jgi:DNA-binding transcriptional regulator YdaS (Cro superfamily)
MSFDEIIARAGGVVALSRATGIKPSTISKWRGAKGGIPAERVPEVSRITGIPRHELRPDLWEAPASAAPASPSAPPREAAKVA